MAKPLIPILFLFIILITPALIAGATSNDWPEFRGPTGQGIASDTDPPLHWSQTNNIVWKKAIAGGGWSSPVIYKGCVYLTTALVGDDGKPTSLRVICLKADSGDIVWDREVFVPKDPVPKHGKNSFASPTPVIKDDRIFVHFGHMGTACLDLNGKIIWRQNTLTYDPKHGNGSSPVLFEDKLILIVTD